MKRRVSALAVAFLPLAACIAVAGEEAHGPGHDGGIPFGSLLFSTVNLCIFLWVLARFALPTVRTLVKDRRAGVVKELEDAAAAKAEAERLRTEWEARLADLQGTTAEMRAQAQRDAERERERSLAAARAAAETIRRDAERAAAYELRRTQEQLRTELVRQAVRLAEESTRAQWSAADQQRFVADFLKQVGQQ